MKIFNIFGKKEKEILPESATNSVLEETSDEWGTATDLDDEFVQQEIDDFTDYLVDNNPTDPT